MRMVPDQTGRFAERPHYTPEELDRECERIITAFLQKRHGEIRFPVTTDELHVLIEQTGASVDAYADLRAYGADVEGVTAFFPDRDPEVSISEQLANDPRRENRLRTTLSHEFGHVHLHRHLWAEKLSAGNLFARRAAEVDNKAICKRDTMIGAVQSDWMEWQAGYVSGAILMPASRIRRLVADYCQPLGLHGSVNAASQHGRQLVGAVMEEFAVSVDAACVRLLKLSLLGSGSGTPSLFG